MQNRFLRNLLCMMSIPGYYVPRRIKMQKVAIFPYFSQMRKILFMVKTSQFIHLHRRRHSRASPVLTAISLVNGKPWETVNFDPPQNWHILTDL